MWNSFIERWNQLTAQQKISVGVLSVCGALAIGLSVFRLRASVFEPFMVDASELTDTKKIVGLTPEEEAAKLKRLDTDGDGLSDWDEINVTKTNPNLRDTCGDGVTDNVRALSGKGTGCGAQAPNAAGVLDTSGIESTSSTSNALLPGAKAIKDSQDAAAGSSTSPAYQQSLDAFNGINQAAQAVPRDAAYIRSILKGQVTDEQLQAISDEELLKMYDEALSQVQPATQ